MKITKQIILVDEELIAQKIYIIRRKKVMIDRDLAKLYGVETKVLNQAVKRNIDRFPKDFMFQLNQRELENWKSQIVTSNFTQNKANIPRSQFVTLESGKNVKYRPFAFTELGVAMLSSVLKSDRAVQVNIQIMRMFTKLREMLATHKELREKIEALEKKYDENFSVVFRAIKRLLDAKKDESSKRPIGFNLSK